MKPTPGNQQTFYRWVDAGGRVHIVSSLESVPQAERAKAAVVSLDPDAAPTVPRLPSAGWRPDWVSFGVGFAVALVLAALFKVLPNGMRMATRVALVLGVAAVLTGLYLGVVRGSTGAPDAGGLTSPSALIDDAKSAVERMNLRQKQQEEELKQIQAEH
ncbi:MAG: DUF4124 domain-containing protein [Myxococcales bacterium]